MRFSVELSDQCRAENCIEVEPGNGLCWQISMLPLYLSALYIKYNINNVCVSISPHILLHSRAVILLSGGFCVLVLRMWVGVVTFLPDKTGSEKGPVNGKLYDTP